MNRNIKDVLLGKPLATDQLKGEKFSRLWGFPIMASDAVSSVAYAVEEILMALVPFLGMAAVHYVGFVSLPIILLLLILVFSYTQIINHYPNGGGSYIVSKENFGHKSSFLAAACLIIDYIMTVAVSVSSSSAAIVAAFPPLAPYRVLVALASLFLITLINLRGARESSKIFGVPTFLFIFAMAAMIIMGFVRVLMGDLAPVSYPPELLTEQLLPNITLLLFLRAFSSGCSALTGVEAVSNAIPSFKEPSQRTAKHVLFMLCGVIVFIFGGTSFLATVLKVVPIEHETVMSQMALAIFGAGPMFYFLQITTFLILLLAANTAYNGLPILLALLAKDRYMPHQFAQRGAKLSFSNGIMFVAIVSAILLIVFGADTHGLIPFYAVGVFVSFTISQAGMFVKWMRDKEAGWRHKSLINGVGSLVTFVGSIVVFVTKFTQGAWALVLAIPLIMLFMNITFRHYRRFYEALSIKGYDYHYKPSASLDKLPCVVLVHNMNKATLKILDYAKDISSNLTALHISTDAERTEELQTAWKELAIDIPLTVLRAPYRDITPPLEQYICMRERQLEKGKRLTVVLTKFVGNGWRDAIFHNQTTFFLENRLGRHKNVATVLVPYIYNMKEHRRNGLRSAQNP